MGYYNVVLKAYMHHLALCAYAYVMCTKNYGLEHDNRFADMYSKQDVSVQYASYHTEEITDGRLI